MTKRLISAAANASRSIDADLPTGERDVQGHRDERARRGRGRRRQTGHRQPQLALDSRLTVRFETATVAASATSAQ